MQLNICSFNSSIDLHTWVRKNKS